MIHYTRFQNSQKNNQINCKHKQVSMDLLENDSSDSGDEDKLSFKINKNYAKNYDTWRKKEERQKCKNLFSKIPINAIPHTI